MLNFLCEVLIITIFKTFEKLSKIDIYLHYSRFSVNLYLQKKVIQGELSLQKFQIF